MVITIVEARMNISFLNLKGDEERTFAIENTEKSLVSNFVCQTMDFYHVCIHNYVYVDF